MHGRVLIIATSDCSGGAGIQADIKTVTALNGYGMTALAALTSQNTQKLYRIIDLPGDFIAEQIMACISDIGVDAVKIGMLHLPENMTVVAKSLYEHAKNKPVVLDPVMVSKTGAKLITDEAVRMLKVELMPLTTILTPNIPEAEVLAGMKIQSLEDMKTCATMLRSMGPEAVLLKGGHLPGDQVMDVLATEDDMVTMVKPWLQSQHTHGTGCTLSSAIATGLAQGLSLTQSVRRAVDYVHQAIRTAPGLGHGHGPLNHAWTVQTDLAKAA
jgi:hydroxymethylpyrimidine/phosphomethylpyrimidine kinase